LTPVQEESLYPNLKLQLWRSGIRQNWLAQRLGIDETVFSRMVNGFREPTQEVRAKIAELLSSEEEWLFDQRDRSEFQIPVSRKPPVR
jgi:transcriptional regulator with XRE-family HTH domain